MGGGNLWGWGENGHEKGWWLGKGHVEDQQESSGPLRVNDP